MTSKKDRHPLIPTIFKLMILVVLVLQGCAVDEVLKSSGGSLGVEISVVRFATGSVSDIDQVTIDVVDAAGSPTYISGQVLAKAGDAYIGTLSGLPLDTPLDFVGHAFDAGGTEIYSGTTRVSLTSSTDSLSLILNPVDDGEPIDLPIIRQITLPAAVLINTIEDIIVDVSANPSETLSFFLTPEAPFNPATGDVVMDGAGDGTVTTSYAAPATEGIYPVTFKLEDSTSASVEVDFDIEVETEPSQTDVNVYFAPAITSLKVKRSGDQLFFTASVSDDQPISELVYSWQLDGVEFSAANPGVYDGYDETVAGTVSLAVTDENGTGVTTSISFALIAGQFPDDLVVKSPPPEEGYDIYLLMGQSNMVGRDTSGRDTTTHPRVFEYTRAQQWVSAADPLEHNDGADFSDIGAGPGLEFGKTMAAALPDAQIGLIPTAKGGSSITEWEPGDTLYDDAIARAQAVVAAGDGVIKGIVWHQGESDAKTTTDIDLHPDRLKALIQNIRTDLGDPDLPFVCGEIFRGLPAATHPYSAEMNQILRNLSDPGHPDYVANTYTASSESLTDKGDNVHFDADSARELGRRMAQGMLGLLP